MKDIRSDPSLTPDPSVTEEKPVNITSQYAEFGLLE
jgi:hypothetical protein